MHDLSDKQHAALTALLSGKQVPAAIDFLEQEIGGILMHTYSSFWIGYALGLISLSPAFAARDLPAELHPAEALDMAAWLRLPDMERVTIVEQYTTRRPRASRLNERQAA